MALFSLNSADTPLMKIFLFVLMCNTLMASELKTAEDPECQIYLGWGHGNVPENEIRRKAPDASGIGMGCNTGKAGVGGLKDKPQYWRYQRGTNALWANYKYQGTQSGGLNPVILEKEDVEKKRITSLATKNSYVGFMRLLQYHWLQLKNYADDYLLGKTCREVKMMFNCFSGDLTDQELNRRYTSWLKPVELEGEMKTKYEKELEIINRFTPLKNCYQDLASIPMSCNEEFIVTSETKMNAHCGEWVKDISEIPQQNAATPESLPRPKSYSYPSKIPLN
jgi:hypothetical protein